MVDCASLLHVSWSVLTLVAEVWFSSILAILASQSIVPLSIISGSKLIREGLDYEKRAR